jgi:Domain of unknown function (DUF4345)
MDTLVRILIGVIAAIMLVQGLGFWFRIDVMNGLFALSTLNDLGFASIRADFAGFFLAVGLFCAYAAWKRHRQSALGAAILFIIAFVGRVISLAFEGAVAGGIPPMAFESLSAAILLWARSSWQNG